MLPKRFMMKLQKIPVFGKKWLTAACSGNFTISGTTVIVQGLRGVELDLHYISLQNYFEAAAAKEISTLGRTYARTYVLCSTSLV